MDWLEEWAEKLKQYIKDTTLVRAVIPYLLIAMLGSLACSDLTVNLTSLWINVMTERVPMPDEEIQILSLPAGSTWRIKSKPLFLKLGWH